MATTAQKLRVLAKIGGALNGAGVTWAVGASLLLFFRGITDSFHDIDITAAKSDAKAIKELLLPMGRLLPEKPNAKYATRHFYEFVIDGVDIDVIAGFSIISGGEEHDCSLTPAAVVSHVCVGGVTIPLQSIADWRDYYALMGRSGRVAQIDEYLRREDGTIL